MINHKNIEIINHYSKLHNLNQEERVRLLKEQRSTHKMISEELEQIYTRKVTKYLLRN